jgi:hypothetical protein
MTTLTLQIAAKHPQDGTFDQTFAKRAAPAMQEWKLQLKEQVLSQSWRRRIYRDRSDSRKAQTKCRGWLGMLPKKSHHPSIPNHLCMQINRQDRGRSATIVSNNL